MIIRRIKSLSCVVVWTVLIVLTSLPGVLFAGEKAGTIELVGVPKDFQGGSYDSDAGVFRADVSAIEGAEVRIVYDDMVISGQQLEWRTKDDYFIFTNGAVLQKEDLDVESNTMEYFGDEETLSAAGEVKVVTSEAVVFAQNMVYSEADDEALFTDDVRVELTDGVLWGQRFLMQVETQAMQFFGPFQGEFTTDSNK